jgi:hypothetical protein
LSKARANAVLHRSTVGWEELGIPGSLSKIISLVGRVTHAYSSSCSGDRGRRITVQVIPRPKHETLSESKKGWWCGSSGRAFT